MTSNINKHENEQIETDIDTMSEPIMNNSESPLNYLLKDDIQYYEDDIDDQNTETAQLSEKNSINTINNAEGKPKARNNVISRCYDYFTHSQLYVHMLMFSTLLTFGGTC